MGNVRIPGKRIENANFSFLSIEQMRNQLAIKYGEPLFPRFRSLCCVVVVGAIPLSIVTQLKS
jgi:hypothetical protein